MSEKFIPEYVDPFRLAEQNLRLNGPVKLIDMHRLNVSRQEGSADELVYAKLHFGVDEQGLTYLKGHVEAKVDLQCQRCLEHFRYEIISDFALGIIKSLDEEKSLPELYEPAVVNDDGQLALRELIEDELILNLPIIPRHATEQCKVQLPLADAGWKEVESGRENPFQVLKTLKHKEK